MEDALINKNLKFLFFFICTSFKNDVASLSNTNTTPEKALKYVFESIFENIFEIIFESIFVKSTEIQSDKKSDPKSETNFENHF